MPHNPYNFMNVTSCSKLIIILYRSCDCLNSHIKIVCRCASVDVPFAPTQCKQVKIISWKYTVLFYCNDAVAAIARKRSKHRLRKRKWWNNRKLFKYASFLSSVFNPTFIRLQKMSTTYPRRVEYYSWYICHHFQFW